MPSNSYSIPKWIRVAALLIVLGQAGALGLVLAGKLHGPARNLGLQAVLGGATVLVALAGYLLRYHSEIFRSSPSRIGLPLLTLLALALTGLYAVRVYQLLTLPYDLASWTETFFITDIIKLRTGTSLYLPPDDSNSSVYTPGAPAVSYFLAWVFGRTASIPFYRLLQQFYLVLAAIAAAAATWHLVQLAMPERFPRLSRLWWVFFALASFLFATSSPTSAYNLYLHTDPLALLASTLAFWLMMKHAVTRKAGWLWAMSAMPSLAFLVKEYLAIWAAVYFVYLWLDGSYPLRRLLVFATASFGALGITIAACLVVWGNNFRYWAFELLTSAVVSFYRISERLADAAWCLALGVIGGLILLRGSALTRRPGIWIGWVVMVLGAIYTAGLTWAPTHFGPATLIGNCFFLSALVRLWPDESDANEPGAQQWLQLALTFVLVVLVFAGLGFTRSSRLSVSPDLSRYVQQIEHEFDGLPTERVLLDSGDWIYLRQNVVMKDRSSILTNHLIPHYGMIGRIRRQEYAKILIHSVEQDRWSYDLGRDRGIGKELMANYHKVRHIRGVQGMDNWFFHSLMMGDVSVLEPIESARVSREDSTGTTNGRHR